MSILDLFGLLGGLGLFLYGMEWMGEGLRSAAGNRLKRILEVLTTNRLMGVMVGTLVTLLIQSSSATTVMLVGFVNAGLMNLSQAFGVMLGANIGTTITAQIIAFELTDWAPLFVFAGIIPLLFVKKRSVQNYGRIVAGFGVLFLGMHMMSSAMIPLRDTPWFVSLMTRFSNPILGVLAGVIFTGIIQSSSASVGIVQTLAAQGLLGLPAGLFLTLGCNIGTCVTALLASIDTTAPARRTAFMHLINKIIGVLVFMMVMAVLPIADWVQTISPGDPSRQIANFHTLFNILNTIMLLPMGSFVISLACRFVPDKPTDQQRALLYINERSLDTPTLAMVQLHQELIHLTNRVYANYQLAAEAFFEENMQKVEDCFKEERNIDYISGEITAFVVKMQSLPRFGEVDERELFRLYQAISDLERIGDHAENIAEFAEERINTNTTFTLEAIQELMEMTTLVRDTLTKGIEIISGGMNEADYTATIGQCYQMEERVDGMHAMMREHHILRLNQGHCDPRAGMIFTDMAIDLERISDHVIGLTNLRDLKNLAFVDSSAATAD